MSSIDERIVKMVFDNDKFEAGVRTTLDTLEKLKEKLTFKDHDKAFKGIETSMNNVNFGGIESGIESLNKRFSTLGIVGMEVTRRLTNAAIDAGKSILQATIGQAKEGGMSRALKIEQARFQLKGLGLDVEEVMNNASEAVDGTAYGLDEAAAAASVLGASGVKAGKEMTDVLTSISGAAAMTGRSYSDIANIYSTVASNGKLMTMQLRQFAASGLNVSAVLKEYYRDVKGIANITEEDINNMVTHGEISFKTFTAAMDKFGEHAKGANDLYTGSLANMKAALNRIGELFASPYIKNMTPIFNAVKDGLNEVKAALVPFADQIAAMMEVVSNFVVNGIGKLKLDKKSWEKGIFGGLGNLVIGLCNIFNALLSAILPIGPAFKAMFPNATIDNLNKLINKFVEWTQGLILNKKQTEHMTFVYKGFFSILKLVGTIIKTVVTQINKMLKPFGGLLNIVITVMGVIGRLVYHFVTLVTNVRLVCRIFTLLTNIAGVVFTVISFVAKAIKKAFDAIRNSKPVVLIIAAISTAFETCKKHITSVVDRFKEFTKKGTDFISSGLGKALTKFSDLLSRGFTLLAGAVSKVTNKLKELFSIVKQSHAFNSFINKVSELRNALSNWFKEHDVLRSFLSILSSGLQAVIGVIVIVVSKVKEFASSFISFLKESGLWEKFVDLLKKGFELIKEGITNSIEFIKEFGKIIAEKMQKPMEKLGDIASLLKDKIKQAFQLREVQNGIGVFSNAADKAKTFGEKIARVFELVKNIIKLAVDKIKTYADKFKNIGSDTFSFIQGILGKINFEKIAKYFPIEAFGILLLSLSKFISNFSLGTQKIVDSLVGVANGFKRFEDSVTGLVGVISERIKPNKWKGRALVLAAFAGSIFLLAMSIKALSSMDKDDLAKGLATVAGLIVTVSLAMIAMGAAANAFKDVNYAQIGLGLIGIAGAVLLLEVAVRKFGEMDPNVLSKGGRAVAIAVLGLALAVNMMQATDFNKTGLGLLILVLALSSLTSVIQKFNSLDSNTFIKGMGLIVLSLLAFTLATNALDNANLPKTAAGLFVLNFALLALVGVIKLFSMIKGNTFAKGMGLITIAIVAFAAAAHMLNGVDLSKTTKGLFGMVAALAAVSGLIWFLGKLDFKSTAVAAGSLAGVLISMSLALKMLSKQDNLIKTAGSLMMVAGALGILALAIYAMKGVDLGNMIAGFAGLAVVLAVMSVSLYKLSEKDDLAKTASSLIIVSAALAILALSINAMKNVNLGNMIAGFAGLAVVLAVMAVSLHKLSGDSNLIETASSLILVSAALVIVSAAVIAMGQIPFNSLIPSLVGVIALMAAMAISLKLLSGNSEGSEQAAKSILMVSASILVLSAALLVLGQLSWQQLAVGLAGLAGALLILVGVGAIAGLPLVATGLTALSGALSGIGGLIVAVATAILILTQALSMLSEMGPEAMQKVVDGVVTFMTGLANSAPIIAASAVQIGLSFIQGLTSLIPQIVSLGLQMIAGLLAGIASNIGSIVQMAVAIIVNFIAGLSAALPILIQAAIALMINFVNGLADGIRTGAPLLLAAAKNMMSAVLEAILSALQELTKDIPVIGEKISSGLEKAKDGLQKAFDVEGTKKRAKDLMNSVKDEANAGVQPILDKFGNIKNGIKEKLTGMTGDASTGGKGIISNFLAPLQGGTGEATAASDALGQAGVSGLDLQELANQYGIEIPEEFAGGIASGVGQGSDAGSALGDSVLGQLDAANAKMPEKGSEGASGYSGAIASAKPDIGTFLSLIGKAFRGKNSDFKSEGEKSGRSYAEGLRGGGPQRAASDAGKGIATNASSAAGKVDWSEAGSACVSGFNRGISSSTWRAEAQASAMASAALKAAKKALDSNSPSKEFIKLGKDVDLGFIIGMTRLQNKVYNAGYNVATKAIDAVSEPMKKVYDILNQDLDMNPTITPVLDLSQINDGVSRMNNMLDTNAISASVSHNMSGVGLSPAFAAAGNSTVSNNTTNTFNITVDGAENPEAFADRLVRQFQLRGRMA